MSTKQGSGGGSRWLTDLIRKCLPGSMPDEQKNRVSATSARVASITEMGLSEVGYYASHARSGHAVSSNQQKYLDRDHLHLTMKAAKALAGWTNRNGVVSPPNLACLGISLRPVGRHHRLGPNSGGSSGGSNGRGSSGGGSSGGGGSGGGETT